MRLLFIVFGVCLGHMGEKHMEHTWFFSVAQIKRWKGDNLNTYVQL